MLVGVVRKLASLSVVLAATAGGSALAEETLTLARLEAYHAGAGKRLVADDAGNLAAWGLRTGVIRTWQSDGSPRSACRIEDPRLPSEPNTFAYRDGRALLSYFDFVAGSESERRLVLVDTDRCSVQKTLSLPGIVHSLASTRNGWLVLTHEPFAGGSQLVTLDQKGEVDDTISLDRNLGQLALDQGIEDTAMSRLGRPIAFGREVWILPHASYELWFPSQRGRAFRRVLPPPCLEARGRELRGEENVSHLLEKIRAFSEQSRRPLEEVVLGGRATPTLIAAAGSIAAGRDTLGVTVHDAGFASGMRLDLWDMVTETIQSVRPFPANTWLVALGDGGAWVVEDGERVRWHPLPTAAKPMDDPCSTLASIAAASFATREVMSALDTMR